MSTDWAPEPDLDLVAAEAIRIAWDMRVGERDSLYGDLTALCATRPAHAAQLLMAFAAWFDVNAPTRLLNQRADDVRAVDWRAVEWVSTERVRMNLDDPTRAETIRRMATKPMTLDTVAELVGTSQRQVCRVLARHAQECAR